MNIKQTIKWLINSSVSNLGLEIRRKTVTDSVNRQTLLGSLQNIKKLGFEPKTVIDVGAAAGTFQLYETFPNAKHILIEPLEENKPYLEKIVSQYKDCEYLIAVATKTPGTAVLNVHPDLEGSSLYLECEDSNVNGSPRTVPAIALDDICLDRNYQSPYLIKIDVQGAELDVLAGATEILKQTEYVILEVVLFEFFKNGPQFYDTIDFMKQRGFVVYDILDYWYRPLDNAMSQVDIAFVKESGQFRKYHFYATKEQREVQNALLLSGRSTSQN
ncbi:MAG TPA: FkbM family methyltransferase [Leptolyngbyaceae cyanobacterium]